MSNGFANRHKTPLFAQDPRQVHTITDRSSITNTYLINSDSIVVVDPSSELHVHLALDYIQRFLHRSPADIDLIVLTHLHPDHTAGVEVLQRFCKAPVAASAVAHQLAQTDSSGMKFVPGITQLAGRALSASFQHLDIFPIQYDRQIKLVDIWLEDVTGLFAHPDWRVIASPGHTPDSICLYNPFTLELLCGDTVITIEGGNPLAHASTNRRLLEETLHMLRNLEVRYLYPGHGRPILARHPLSNIFIH